MRASDWKNKLKRACFTEDTYLDRFDVPLKMLSEMLERRDLAYESYDKVGGTPMIEDENGKQIRNPALSTIESTEKAIFPYIKALGLTPSDLKDIQVMPKEEKKDTFDKLLDEVIS